MFQRFLPAALCAAALLPAPGRAAPLTLDDALSLAAQQSLAVRAARAGAASATEAAHVAGQWPDPVLGVGIDNLPVTGAGRFRPDADFMTMKRIGLTQEWVPAAKRRLREAAGEAQAAREAAGIAVARGEARLQAALAYVDAFYATESLALAQQKEHHLHEEVQAARARLASATGNAGEVLALLASGGSAEDESADLRQQAASAMVMLERWVRVRPDSLVVPSWPALAEEDAYVDAAPAVVLARADLDVAHREADLVDSQRTPNWTWQVAYAQRSGRADMLSVGVSVPLVLAPERRQDRDTAAKRALADKAEAVLEEARRAAQAEFRALLGDAQRLAVRIERHRSGVLAPARQRVEAALAGYRSSQVPLVTVFEARHAEVEMQRRLLGLQQALAKVRARLAFMPIPAVAP